MAKTEIHSRRRKPKSPQAPHNQSNFVYSEDDSASHAPATAVTAGASASVKQEDSRSVVASADVIRTNDAVKIEVSAGAVEEKVC